MIRSLKTLGLALLAIGAISATTASAASANPQFHSELEDTVLTALQGQAAPNILEVDLGELKCKTVKYSGTQPVFTTTTMTLKPKYEECQVDEEEATVTENGCGYLFHLAANTENHEASMDIECPTEGQIVIHTPNCTIMVPEQAGLQTTTFTNEGMGTTRSLIADLNVNTIHYVEHGVGCASHTETTDNGTYTGQFTVTGEDSIQQHVGIWVG